MAHPRSRGENLIQCDLYPLDTGSSPLTRGKPRRRSRSRYRLGLIPAHAGKTSSRRSAATSERAHPRSRGENEVFEVFEVGSSPLTRGKLVREAPPEDGGRLIPAHAGKTHALNSTGRPDAAHPRSRGENGTQVAGLRGVRGSSPLTRGKLALNSRRCRHLRLIPAHAGKT